VSEIDKQGRKVDPRYHDCVYDGENRYRVCGQCIYRFTCKWIRYDLGNPLKEEVSGRK